jgi:hypothetical protein
MSSRWSHYQDEKGFCLLELPRLFELSTLFKEVCVIGVICGWSFLSEFYPADVDDGTIVFFYQSEFDCDAGF